MPMSNVIIFINSSTQTVHGRGADLPFFCVLATVQYWHRQIYSIDRRNPRAYAPLYYNLLKPTSRLLICGLYFFHELIEDITLLIWIG